MDPTKAQVCFTVHEMHDWLCFQFSRWSLRWWWWIGDTTNFNIHYSPQWHLLEQTDRLFSGVHCAPKCLYEIFEILYLLVVTVDESLSRLSNRTFVKRLPYLALPREEENIQSKQRRGFCSICFILFYLNELRTSEH